MCRRGRFFGMYECFAIVAAVAAVDVAVAAVVADKPSCSLW